MSQIQSFVIIIPKYIFVNVKYTVSNPQLYFSVLRII